MFMPSVNLPQFPVSGGCQCGHIRYSLKAAPVVFYLCHCTHCQKQSSSAFGESVKVRATDIDVMGDPAAFEVTADSGKTKRCEFCPKCGTRLFHGRSENAETFNIKGGTLDDASWLVPAGHIWTRSKQAFYAIGPDEIAYASDPDYVVLTAKWREMIGDRAPTSSPPR
jgi:hypothetical protein